jgi:hypothetical protein
MKNDDDHEISGQPIADEILTKFGYPRKTIEEIKHVIATHRGSTGPEPKTITAKIIANADAMAHFDAVPWLLQIGLENNSNDLSPAVAWVRDKMERNWNTKLTLPEAKEIIKPKYEAAMLLLK